MIDASGFGTVRRIREIFRDAPWSAYDLLSSMIVFGIGCYLLTVPDMFSRIGGVYQSMASVADELCWAWLFISCGGVGIANTLWCQRPSFKLRLLSRMGVAFCMLSFALNNLVYQSPPLSTITYLLLASWSMWGIFRTKSSGR